MTHAVTVKSCWEIKPAEAAADWDAPPELLIGYTWYLAEVMVDGERVTVCHYYPHAELEGRLPSALILAELEESGLDGYQNLGPVPGFA